MISLTRAAAAALGSAVAAFALAQGGHGTPLIHGHAEWLSLVLLAVGVASLLGRWWWHGCPDRADRSGRLGRADRDSRR